MSPTRAKTARAVSDVAKARGDIPGRWPSPQVSPVLAGNRSEDRQQEVDHRLATIELDAWTRSVPVSPSGELLEGWADQAVYARRLAFETYQGIAASGQLADLKTERIRFISITKLDANPILVPIQIERSEVLPASKPDRLLHLSHPATDRIRLVRNPLEHHRHRFALDQNGLIYQGADYTTG
jgi:hypothetical protein